VLGDQLYIPKASLSVGLHNRLLRLATFQNPEFYKFQAMRLTTFRKPRIMACAEDFPQHNGLPRGCLEVVTRLLDELGVAVQVRDERFSGNPLPASFQGVLTPEQQIAVAAMVPHDIGVLAAATAFGKTVVGPWLIPHRRVNTLVLVHRRQLQAQWVERLATFLGLPAEDAEPVG
jgi:hypothetical protein